MFYIKILPFIKRYAEQNGLASDEIDQWQRAIFDDITEEGSGIVYLPSVNTPKGPTIALYGNRFVCHAGMDQGRSDSLFLVKILPANEYNGPKDIPIREKAEVRLLTRHDSTAEHGTPIAKKVFSHSGEIGSLGMEVYSRSRVSSRLRSAIEDCDTEVLGAMSWSIPPSLSTADVISCLAELVKLGNAFELLDFQDREIDPNDEQFFQRKEGIEVLATLGIGFLNKFAEKNDDPGLLSNALSIVLALPISIRDRMILWSVCWLSRGLEDARNDFLKRSFDGLKTVLEICSESENLGSEDSAETWEDFESACSHDSSSQQFWNDHFLEVSSFPEFLDSISELAGKIAEEEIQADLAEITDSVVVADAEVGSKWVSQALLENDQEFINIRESIGNISEELSLLLDAPISDSPDSSPFLEKLLRLLPIMERVANFDNGGCREKLQETWHLFARAEQYLGDGVEELLEHNWTPEQLGASLSLAERIPLVSIPESLWNKLNAYSEKSLAEFLRILRSPENAEKIDLFLGHQELVENDEVLINYLFSDAFNERVAEDGNGDALVKDYIQQFDKVGEGLFAKHPRIHELADQIGMDRISNYSNRMSALEELLPDNVMDLLIKDLGELSTDQDFDDTFLSWEAAQESIESLLGEGATKTIQIDQWLNVLEKHAGQRSAAPVHISAGHCWVAEKGSRPPLVYTSSPNTPMYGTIKAPVQLESLKPLNCQFDLDVKLKTDQRDTWPSDWPDIHPREVEIELEDWIPDGGKYVYNITLEIPVRALENTKSTSFGVMFSASSQEGKNVALTELNWDSVRKTYQDPVMKWGTEESSDYVEQHPIGPQENARDIMARVEGSESFAVLAPRRFGKSTLIRYLKQHLSSKQTLVLEPVICTSFFSNKTLALSEVWDHVSASLSDLGCSPIGGSKKGDFPDASCFKNARKTAFNLGYKRILIMFDEAQLLFAEQGATLGDRMKDLIEHHLIFDAQEGLSAVCFGLVGLPILYKRGGTNLMAALRPISASDIGEGALNRLLLNVTDGGIATTRLARQQIIARAGRNLLVLKSLADKLIDISRNEGRIWIDHRDIDDSMRELCNALENNTDMSLAEYARDSLNGATHVTDWVPLPCYPFALAMAKTSKASRKNKQKLLEEAKKTIEVWVRELPPIEGTQFVVPSDLPQRDLEELQGLGIVERLNFRSELLEAYLAGRSSEFPSDELDKKVLVQAISERIKLPEDKLEKVSSGSQATIFRYIDESGKKLAVRRIVIGTDEERHRFLESAESLSQVYRGLDGRPEAKNIYRLQKIGMTTDGSGCEIYRWVEGSILQNYVGKLYPENVAKIGVPILQALGYLHDLGILHRDVHPQNIVLTEDHTPVLIDFGLVRRKESGSKTIVDNSTAAPEVKTRGEWSQSADVYSAASTLKQLLNDHDDRELVSIFDKALCENPSERCTAHELSEMLSALLAKRSVVEILDEHWAKIGKLSAKDGRHAAYQGVIDQYRNIFEFALLNPRISNFEKSIEIAGFLSTVGETQRSPSTNKKLSIGQLSHEGVYEGVSFKGDEISYVN